MVGYKYQITCLVYKTHQCRSKYLTFSLHERSQKTFHHETPCITIPYQTFYKQRPKFNVGFMEYGLLPGAGFAALVGLACPRLPAPNVRQDRDFLSQSPHCLLMTSPSAST